MASLITGVSFIYAVVWSGADDRNHQSSASLVCVQGIHQSPVNSPHKGPVTRKMFPFDNVIVILKYAHGLWRWSLRPDVVKDWVTNWIDTWSLQCTLTNIPTPKCKFTLITLLNNCGCGILVNFLTSPSLCSKEACRCKDIELHFQFMCIHWKDSPQTWIKNLPFPFPWSTNITFRYLHGTFVLGQRGYLYRPWACFNLIWNIVLF